MDTLLHAALSNAVVAAVLAMIVTAFGRVSRRPALVHSLWLLVLLKLLTPPVWPVPLSWLVRPETKPSAGGSVADEPGLAVAPVNAVSRGTLPDEGAGGLPDETAPPAALAAALFGPESSLPESPPAAQSTSLPEPSNPSPTAMAFSVSWQSWFFTIWLAGSILWLTLAGSRLCRFHRLLRRTQRAPAPLQDRARRLAQRLGLARCPGVWVVPAPVSPLLWALVGEARLLVPASLLQRLTDEQWDTLLAHELAHLRRRDHWVRILELAVLALYWWHPVAWWARRQLREAEEQCCDAWVVWALPGATEAYATALVEAVTYLSDARSALPLAASGIGQMRFLKRRLTMIMRGTTPRALSAAGSLVVLGLAAVLLPLYPTWARTEQQADATGDQQPSSGPATTIGRAGDGEDQPGPNPAAGPIGGRGGLGSDSQSYGRGGGERGTYSETVDDAQDDVDLLRMQLDQRRAEKREVEARLRQARSALERFHHLQTTNAVGRDIVEQANTEVEVQEARLAGKDAQIKEAELRLKQAQRRLAKLRGSASRPPERSMAGPAGAAGMRAPGISVPGGMPGAPAFPGSAPPGRPMSGGFGGFGTGGPSSGSGFSGGPGFGGSAMLAYTGATTPSYDHRLAEVEKSCKS